MSGTVVIKDEVVMIVVLGGVNLDDVDVKSNLLPWCVLHRSVAQQLVDKTDLF